MCQKAAKIPFFRSSWAKKSYYCTLNIFIVVNNLAQMCTCCLLEISREPLGIHCGVISLALNRWLVQQSLCKNIQGYFSHLGNAGSTQLAHATPPNFSNTVYLSIVLKVASRRHHCPKSLQDPTLIGLLSLDHWWWKCWTLASHQRQTCWADPGLSGSASVGLLRHTQVPTLKMFGQVEFTTYIILMCSFATLLIS